MTRRTHAKRALSRRRCFARVAESDARSACICGPCRDRTCGGTGWLQCWCGGETCVCRACGAGEVECYGCRDCYDPPDDDVDSDPRVGRGVTMSVEIDGDRGVIRCDKCGAVIGMDRRHRIDATLAVDLCEFAVARGWSFDRGRTDNDCCAGCFR